MSIAVSKLPTSPTDLLPTRWAAAHNVVSPGRFRLYVSYACPWSHRVLIARALNGHDNAVTIVDVEPEMDAVGWRLQGEHLIDCYRSFAPAYTGKATVPLMVEIATGQVVSNESADLMRTLGTLIQGSGRSLFPTAHAAACDVWNVDLQVNVNARVYQFGIAANEKEKAVKTRALMEAFDRVDRHLATNIHLVVEDAPLEPDWRLWTTLARYDLAYRPFLLSPDAAPLASFPHLERFFTSLLEVPGIRATFRPEDIVRHYAARCKSLKSNRFSNAA